jgi:hypothetical protein
MEKSRTYRTGYRLAQVGVGVLLTAAIVGAVVGIAVAAGGLP